MVEAYQEECTFETEAAPLPLLSREDLSFLVLSGPSAGQYRRLPRDGGTIGRDPELALSVQDPGVSRHHARLEREAGGRYSIRDLDSRYGVYVEGERITRKVLADGDRIQLSADTVIRVRYQDARETEILERLQEAVVRDALTGVYNRRYFVERFEQEFGFARRHGAPLTMLMIDIDFFKEINDTRGHQVGDLVLRGVGRSLHAAVRVEDLVARYGGDEFVILSRGHDAGDGEAFGQRLLRTVRERPVRIGPEPFPVTLSIGIATYHRGDPEGMMQLIARADSALYEAKRRGRNQVAVWKSEEK